MAYSKATLIQRIRDLLGETPFYTEMTDSIASAGDGDFIVTSGENWATGDIAEFQDDGEQTFVRSVSTNTLTVFRGHNGTTAASAHAANTRIIKNPEFTYARIDNAVKDILIALWPYAWKRISDSITPAAPTTSWYDLAADVIDLIQVNQLFGINSEKVGFFGRPGTAKSIALARDLPAALVASTVGMRFPAGFYHNTNVVNVHYRAKLTSTGTTNYDDITAGLLSDLAMYGAASRLMSSKEGPRVVDNDISYGDTTVNPGLRAQVASVVYENRFIQARNQYYDELMRTIPPMKKWGR